MKKVLAVVLVMILLTLGLLAGCGPVLTKTYDYADFTRVEVGHAFQVKFVQSDKYSISITASEDLLNHIEVSQKGETLIIRVNEIVSFGTRKAEITMPNLHGLNLSGASKGTIQGFSSSYDFDLDVSGASSLTGDIKAGDTQFTVSGASTAQLEGSADDMTVDASGASRIKLADFKVDNADVRLSGASSGTLKLDGRLDADLSGASRLKYVGTPTLGNVDISGSSSLSK